MSARGTGVSISKQPLRWLGVPCLTLTLPGCVLARAAVPDSGAAGAASGAPAQSAPGQRRSLAACFSPSILNPESEPGAAGSRGGRRLHTWHLWESLLLCHGTGCSALAPPATNKGTAAGSDRRSQPSTSSAGSSIRYVWPAAAFSGGRNGKAAAAEQGAAVPAVTAAAEPRQLSQQARQRPPELLAASPAQERPASAELNTTPSRRTGAGERSLPGRRGRRVFFGPLSFLFRFKFQHKHLHYTEPTPPSHGTLHTHAPPHSCLLSLPRLPLPSCSPTRTHPPGAADGRAAAAGRRDRQHAHPEKLECGHPHLRVGGHHLRLCWAGDRDVSRSAAAAGSALNCLEERPVALRQL